jgi:hypothetical protein
MQTKIKKSKWTSDATSSSSNSTAVPGGDKKSAKKFHHSNLFGHTLNNHNHYQKYKQNDSYGK